MGCNLRRKLGEGYRASPNPNTCMLIILPPKNVEGVRIGIQGSVWGREIPFRTHFTKHFRPTPGAWGSELNREKLRRRKIFLSAGEWANVGLCSPPSAHHPTRWFGFFAFSRLHLRWEGSNKDRGKETSAERKGGREIRQESTSC